MGLIQRIRSMFNKPEPIRPHVEKDVPRVEKVTRQPKARKAQGYTDKGRHAFYGRSRAKAKARQKAQRKARAAQRRIKRERGL